MITTYFEKELEDGGYIKYKDTHHGYIYVSKLPIILRPSRYGDEKYGVTIMFSEDFVFGSKIEITIIENAVKEILEKRENIFGDLNIDEDK